MPGAGEAELSERQQAALDVLDVAPLRVIAGPGMGKTATVVEMYLRLTRDLGYSKSEVLVLTFSKNAANELRSRIDLRDRESYPESWISTFHSFAYRLQRDQTNTVPFELMNGFQERLLMRHVLHGLAEAERQPSEGGLEDPALRHLLTSESLAGDVLWLIGALKQEMVTPRLFTRWVQPNPHGASDPHSSPKLRDFARLYQAYFSEQERLRLQDFRDVIAAAVRELERDESLRLRLASKFRYIIVDEYQDVDPAQVRLLSLLTEGHRDFPHLAVVGDPDQSIYSFRGTSPYFIETDFPRRFGGRTVRLDRNYRSVAPIIDAAERLRSEMASASHGEMPSSPLHAARGSGSWPAIQVRHEETSADEAAVIARRILALTRPIDACGCGYHWGDVAIILRSVNRSGRPFEEALQAAGIPHALGLSPHFADSDVVRFGVAALRALSDPDDDQQLYRVLASPLCGVPPADASRLLREASRRRNALRETLRTTSLAKLLVWIIHLMEEEDGRRWPLPWPRPREGSSGPETSPQDGDPLTENPPSISPPAAGSMERIEHEMTAADRLAEAGAQEPPAGEDGGGDGDAPKAESERKPPAFYRLLSAQAKDAIHRFTARWLRLRGLTATIPVDVLVYRIFQDLGVIASLMLRAGSAPGIEAGPFAPGPGLGPLRMFLRATDDLVGFQRRLLGTEPTIAEVLERLEPALREYVDELEPPPDTEGAVRILTVHAAKGMEFPVVLVSALVGGRLPVLPRPRTPLLTDEEAEWVEFHLRSDPPVDRSLRSSDGDGEALAGDSYTWRLRPEEFLREEARLAFVAATRARDLLVLSWADRYDDDETVLPSAFLPALAGHAPVLDYSEASRPPVFRPPSPDEGVPPADWEPWAHAPVPVNPALHDSASSLSSWLACPRKYYYDKLVALPSDSGVAAARGTAFHDALERFHEPETEALWQANPDLAGEAFERCCDEAIERHLRLVDGALEKKAERSILRRLFAHYQASEERHWTEMHTAAVERWFRWTLADGRVVKGRIDRILTTDDGHCEVVDYKTGTGLTRGEVLKRLGLVEDGPPTRLAVVDSTDPRDLQLLVYFFAMEDGAELTPPIEGGALSGGVDAVSLWFPKDLLGAKKEPYIRKVALGDGSRDTKRFTDYVEIGAIKSELRQMLEHHLAEARKGAYPPQPRHDSYTCLSSWSTGCPYVWLCPGRIEEPETYEAEE